MKKIILSLMIITLLSGCTVNVRQPSENNTESNISESETVTTVPPADPVASLDSLSADKVVWGFGRVTEHRRPEEPMTLEEKYSSLGASWFVKGNKTICLTFDEGYENGYTPSILDTLKEKKVKAVFFVTYDFAKDNGGLIKRMIDEGHVVGNHSYHHYSMDELDTDTAKEEVSFLHDYIKDKFGYTISYFRFPKGEFSERALGIVQSLGYKSVFWSFAYTDWDPDSQPEEAASFTNICESTHDGEILLLHAVSKTNASILPKVIDDVRKQGYTFTVNI